MSRRRRGRELAVQVLYQLDITGQEPQRALALFWQNFAREAEAFEFAEKLVWGVWHKREEIHNLIASSAQNWRLGRMAKVDLSILRVATYELLSCPDLPPSIIINEAVEIAKRYGTEESSAFVNGILDRIAVVLGKKEQDGRKI